MDNKLAVENYEHNLRMFHEAKRKENDILLTSSIPTQLTQMKTLLWINFLLIGLMLQTINKFPMSQMLIWFFIFAIFAILVVLTAMLTNKSKSYGVNDDIKTMSYYPDHEWTKSQAIFDMISTVQLSIEHNRKMLQGRSKLLSFAKYFILSGMITIILVFTIKQIS
jgi:cell division protein FtsL